LSSFIVASVLDSATRASRAHSDQGCNIVFLNDISTNLYGLISPLTEIRVLIPKDCIDFSTHTLLESFGISENYARVRSQLAEMGIAATSTRTRPLLVIEVVATRLDQDIVKSPVKYVDEHYEFHIPRLEHLIAKLLALELYPYTLYAASLLFSWIDLVDTELLLDSIEASGKRREKVATEIKKYISHLRKLPVVNAQGIEDKLKSLLKLIEIP